MTSITIPASVTNIDAAFFQMFPNLRTVSVAQDNQTYASYNGMLFTKELDSLLLVPEGLEGVAVLPGGMASVPAYTFSRCIKLSAIQANTTGGTGDTYLTSRNGLLYSADGATLLAAPAGLGATARIDANTTHIAEGAFWGNAALKSIIVEGTVASIERGANGEGAAVSGATAQTILPAFNPDTVNAAVVAIAAADAEAAKGAWLEAGFANYAEAPRPGDTIQPTEGSGFAFTLADGYTLAVRWEGSDAAPADLTIPSYGTLAGMSYDVTAVAPGGFANQSQLRTVSLPDTVTVIGDGAFEGCENLQGAALGASTTTIGARAFANTALRSFVVPAACASIGEAAFDGLSDAAIVAVGTVASVHPAALGASENMSVYVPYDQAEDYAWQVGVPTTGNHLYPYGVKLNSEVFDLEAGQSANLYDNGGYLYAPGDIKVTCSYKAASINVDVESGQVEAKQSGSTNIDIKLTLPIAESVVEQRVNTDAKLEGAAYTPSGVRLVQAAGETEAQVSEGTIDMDLASASKPSIVTGVAANQYSADVPVTRMKSGAKINHISVTAPLQVTFADADNGGNGLDVSQELPSEALTTTATFTNHSTDFGVSLAGVKVRDNAVSSLFQARSGAPAIGDQELVKVSNEKDSISWKPSTDEMTITENTPKNFKLKKGTSADWNVSLNLAQADLTDAAKESANGSTTNFATLVWVFQAMVGGRPEGTATEDDINNVFYLKDLDTQEIYSLSDVRSHSAALTAGDSDEYDFDALKEMYESFARDESLYECVLKTKVTSTPEINLRIVGVLQDILDEKAATTRYAGLTFQIKMLLNQESWGGGSAIDIDYAHGKPGYSTAAGKDSSFLSRTYFSNIKDVVLPVVKKYGVFDKNADATSTSIDTVATKLFSPSMHELGFTTYGSDTRLFMDGLGNNGASVYQFYQSKTAEQKKQDLSLKDTSGNIVNWFTRTRVGTRQSVVQFGSVEVYTIQSGSPQVKSSGVSAYRSYFFCL